MAVAVFGYFSNWFSFVKNPETGKTQVVINKDKFKADKDAYLKSGKDLYEKGKEAVTNLVSKKDKATGDEKIALEKKIEEKKKELEKLESNLKSIETEADEEKLKKAKEGLDDTVKKLLDPK